MMLGVSILAFQRLGGGRYAVPHDSTIGVGTGFYWFSAAVLLFLAGGVAWAYWNDKPWKGRFASQKKSEKRGKILTQKTGRSPNFK